MINEKAEFEYYKNIKKEDFDFKKFFDGNDPQLKRAFIILLRGYLFDGNDEPWDKYGSFNKDTIKNAVQEVQEWAMEFAKKTCSGSDKQWYKLKFDSELKKYAIDGEKSYYISQDAVTAIEDAVTALKKEKQDCFIKNNKYNKKAIDILNQVYTSADDIDFNVNNFRNCLSALVIEAISQGKLRDTDYVLIDEKFFNNNLKEKNGDAKYVIVTAHQKMLLKNNPDASLTKLDIKALLISLGNAPTQTAVGFLKDIKTFIDSGPDYSYLSVGQPYFDKVFLPEEKNIEERSFDNLKPDDIPKGFVAVKIDGHNLKECFGNERFKKDGKKNYKEAK